MFGPISEGDRLVSQFTRTDEGARAMDYWL